MEWSEALSAQAHLQTVGEAATIGYLYGDGRFCVILPGTAIVFSSERHADRWIATKQTPRSYNANERRYVK